MRREKTPPSDVAPPLETLVDDPQLLPPVLRSFSHTKIIAGCSCTYNELVVHCAGSCRHDELWRRYRSEGRREATNPIGRSERERRSLSKEMRFENKVMLITGGGGGIGKTAAGRFLEEGASGVVLNSRRQKVLEAAKKELDPSGERVELFVGDVSKRQIAKAFVGAATERFGGVDVLVNSTGVFRLKPFEEETEADVEEALDTTLRPTFYVSQAAVLDGEVLGGGVRTCLGDRVGSMWAVDAITTTPTSAYSVAQAGTHALTKNLAIE